MHAQANLINKIGHQMPNGRHHDHHQSQTRQNRDGKPNRKNIHLRRDTRHDAGDDIDEHHGNHISNAMPNIKEPASNVRKNILAVILNSPIGINL